MTLTYRDLAPTADGTPVRELVRYRVTVLDQHGEATQHLARVRLSEADAERFGCSLLAQLNRLPFRYAIPSAVLIEAVR